MKMYFDIGANKGDYTEYLFSIGAEKVVCIEANPQQAINVTSRFGNRVIVVNKAVSNVMGPQIPFYVCPECDVVSSADEQWRTNSRFSQPDRNWVRTMVDVITIDELVNQYGIPTHIKLDVEGYEYMALVGMTKNYCQLRFEWSEEKIDEMILSLQHLISIGYTAFGVMAGDTYHMQPDEYMSGEDMIEFLRGKCDPQRKELWGMLFCLRDGDEYVE
jgi:FkbM family methyltransferase